MISQNFYKEKFLYIGNIFFSFKTYKSKFLINLGKITILLNFICDIYNLSLLISVKAFLPSLRVLKTSEERENIIRIVSIIREKRVVSKLIVNLLDFFKSL
ncbi:hypothetical protein CU307_07620 [Prochlorococcus marinus str. MU1411]|nr:hypothetical protein [Prochlorococcus marinus str. MU1411]